MNTVVEIAEHNYWTRVIAHFVDKNAAHSSGFGGTNDERAGMAESL
jgi:hypothetical protein